MNKTFRPFDLMDELVAIREGACLWCKLGLEHPPYSRCRNHNAQEKLGQIVYATVVEQQAVGMVR